MNNPNIYKSLTPIGLFGTRTLINSKKIIKWN